MYYTTCSYAYSELSIGHIQQVHNQVHLPWGWGGCCVDNGCLQPPSLTENFIRFTIAVCKEFTVMLSQWRIHSVLQGCHINVQLHSMIYLCIHLHFYIALGHNKPCDWLWLSQLCLYNQVVIRCIIWACIISWRSIEMMNENEPYL